MIPIFLSADNNYAPYLVVTIKSICENTKSSIGFYILDCNIEVALKNMIIELISKYTGNTIEFINPLKQNIYNECRVRNHLSKAAYVRLMIPFLKPQIDKAIYLDIDMIVHLDVNELYEQDLGDFIIGAVEEDNNVNYIIHTKKALGIDLEHNYFNSGVLLINCKKWRENNITQKLKDIYDEYENRIIHNDQDILNILFSKNKYYNLEKRFNYLIYNEVESNKNIIYHYYGATKPWHFSEDLESEIIKNKDIWWYYAKKTNCFDIIKERCIYKDFNSLRIAKVKKAFGRMNRKLKPKNKDLA